MKIYITTLGRLRTQVTLENMPPDVQRQVIMVVQDHEYADHRALWGDTVGEVRALPPEVRTLGPTRRAVREWAEDEAIVLMDDDLRFYVRRDPTDWHLTYQTPQDYRDMLAWLESRLTDGGYDHAGISAREGNNRVSESEVECTRYMRVLGYNTRREPAGIEHGRVDGMSDFDVNLQLLQAGRPSCVSFLYAQGQAGTQTPGGCAINRTHSTHDAEIDRMVAWHGDLVKVRQKQNKTGGEFGTRRELTIYWQKAYQRGLAARRAAEAGAVA